MLRVLVTIKKYYVIIILINYLFLIIYFQCFLPSILIQRKNQSRSKLFFQGITTLLLLLWGEPLKNEKQVYRVVVRHLHKNHWEGVTLTPGNGPAGERPPEGKEAQKGPTVDSGQKECHRSWDHGAPQTRAWPHSQRSGVASLPFSAPAA